MAVHFANLRHHVLGHNDVLPGRDEAQRDANLDRLWAAHRALATGTKGPHSIVVPSPLTDAELRQRTTAAPRIPSRAVS